MPCADSQLGTIAVDRSDLFELIVESSTDFAIFTMDADGTTESWNIGAERLFGYPETEIIGSSADVVFTAEDRQSGAPERERSQARATGRATDERWHRRRNGSLLWGSGLLMPLKDGSGGFVKIVRDLTQQHRNAEQIRQNEERFRVLATSIPQLVFRTRHDGDRTWGSPQWIDFTGLTLDASFGFGWLDAIHPDDRELTLLKWRDALQNGEYYAEHRVWRQADGVYRWHQTRAVPTDSGNLLGSDWVGTMTDIHDLRGLQDRQQMLLAELQHRTRNLLALVESIAKQTLRTNVSLEAFGADFSDRLRALSRVQSLLAQSEHQRLELQKLVDAEIAAHSGRSDGDGKVVVNGPHVELPATSAQALALALHELATNAVKYGALAQPAGKLIITWSVTADAAGPRVGLEWRESGVVLPANDRPRRKGYGSELIERALPYQLGAKTSLEFRSDGVVCEIVVPVQAGSQGDYA